MKEETEETKRPGIPESGPRYSSDSKDQKLDALDKVLGKKDVKTTVVNQKEVIQTFLHGLKDLGTLQKLLPVARRAAIRYKAIQADAQAKTVKINGEFYTEPPKLHIANLKKKVFTENEAEVSFSVYETDAAGNKVPHHMFAEAQDQQGKPIKILSSSEYRIAYDVRETIKFKEDVQRDITPRLYQGGN